MHACDALPSMRSRSCTAPASRWWRPGSQLLETVERRAHQPHAILALQSAPSDALGPGCSNHCCPVTCTLLGTAPQLHSSTCPLLDRGRLQGAPKPCVAVAAAVFYRPLSARACHVMSPDQAERARAGGSVGFVQAGCRPWQTGQSDHEFALGDFGLQLLPQLRVRLQAIIDGKVGELLLHGCAAQDRPSAQGSTCPSAAAQR